MRVVGGLWKGISLAAPEGRDTTRPTTDRVREAVASLVVSAFFLDMSHCRILDACAGSGALGIEFLSRGAEHVSFYDCDRKALSCIRQNLNKVRAQSNTHTVVSADVFKAVQTGTLIGSPFDCVLLDPPYKTPVSQVEKFVDDLAKADQLSEACFVVYEHAKGTPGFSLDTFECVKEKKYGAILVELYKRR